MISPLAPLSLSLGIALAFSITNAFAAETASSAPVVGPFERFFRAQQDEAQLTEGGLLLLSELNCVSCHAPPAVWEERLPVRGKISLAAVGSRLSTTEIAQYVRDPHVWKPGTIMPSLLHEDAAKDGDLANALASYLATKQPKQPLKKYPKGDADKGRELYHTVGCIACHAPADAKEYKPIEGPPGPEVAKPKEKSVPLALGQLYPPAALAAFLQDPLSIRHAGRMPSTQMTDQEAADLAAYLQRDKTAKPEASSAPVATSESLIAQGRQQFSALRCVACHDSGDKVELLAVKPLASLQSGEEGSGCLSGKGGQGIPRYNLSAEQERALNLALNHIKKTAQPPTFTAAQKSDEFLVRMNCYACHEWKGKGGLEDARAQYLTVYEPSAHSLGEIGRLPPKLDVAGRKLTKSWMQKLLWGKDGAVRPYMTTRMPRFGKDNAASFVDPFTEASAREGVVTMDTTGLLKHHRSEAGRILMGVGKGGLGCVSCHGLKDRKSLGVPVVNLSNTVNRLQREYFKELLLNPQIVQPGTLMPPLFTGRKNAEKEVETIWTYLKELDQSRLPEGLLLTGEYELKPEQVKRPIVFRTFLEGAGMQAIAVGHPQRVHVAFDAFDVHWGVAWKGRFIDAMSTWEERAMTPAVPLGDSVKAMPRIMPLAKLDSPGTAWPETYGEAAGYRFDGYRMGKDGEPVFLYEVGGLKVEDVMRPGADGKSLDRTVTIKGEGAGWYFRGISSAPEAVTWKDGAAVFTETIRL